MSVLLAERHMWMCKNSQKEIGFLVTTITADYEAVAYQNMRSFSHHCTLSVDNTRNTWRLRPSLPHHTVKHCALLVVAPLRCFMMVKVKAEVVPVL
jgi:hypothetical protein